MGGEGNYASSRGRGTSRAKVCSGDAEHPDHKFTIACFSPDPPPETLLFLINSESDSSDSHSQPHPQPVPSTLEAGHQKSPFLTSSPSDFHHETFTWENESIDTMQEEDRRDRAFPGENQRQQTSASVHIDETHHSAFLQLAKTGTLHTTPGGGGMSWHITKGPFGNSYQKPSPFSYPLK